MENCEIRACCTLEFRLLLTKYLDNNLHIPGLEHILATHTHKPSPGGARTTSTGIRRELGAAWLIGHWMQFMTVSYDTWRQIATPAG